MASMMRIKTVSTTPPKNPETMPYTVPTTMVIKPARKPSVIEYWPPYQMRPSSSKPELSVPSQWCAEGWAFQTVPKVAA